MPEFAVVVPWHQESVRDEFAKAWCLDLERPPEFLILQHDADKEGCAVTKNKGVKRAIEMGAEVVVVLDDDCYPAKDASYNTSLSAFAREHLNALKPQRVSMFETVTTPPSRGTPYMETSIEMPVACSMGFWTEIGDYCGPRQLSFRAAEMDHWHQAIHGRYFALSGMNIAFDARAWSPWCSFIDVPRFDDIWMGWLWQKEAYRTGYCFSLHGPSVRHARQSNVWRNTQLEAEHLEANETLWRKIAMSRDETYQELRSLLPV